jgi:hypothetical protein
MSVFRVNLNNVDQGRLDLDPTTAEANKVTGAGLGTPFTVSRQRQVYVMGPNKINRLLNDGETFTDCNYWKKFAYPQVPYNEAFIQVVSDDGSVYSDVPGENTVPVALTETIVAGTSYADNEIDIVATYGGPAVFFQMENQHATDSITVQLNGRDSAIFTLAGQDHQIFNSGDLVISKVAFANTTSGNADVTVQLVFSVRSQCTS